MHRTRIIALAICATLVALWAVVRPDEFWVERVDFEGNVRATPAELRRDRAWWHRALIGGYVPPMALSTATSAG